MFMTQLCAKQQFLNQTQDVKEGKMPASNLEIETEPNEIEQNAPMIGIESQSSESSKEETEAEPVIEVQTDADDLSLSSSLSSLPTIPAHTTVPAPIATSSYTNDAITETKLLKILDDVQAPHFPEDNAMGL